MMSAELSSYSVRFDVRLSLESCIRRLRQLHGQTSARISAAKTTAVQVKRIDQERATFVVRRVPQWELGDPDHFGGVTAEGLLIYQDAAHTQVMMRMRYTKMHRFLKPILLTHPLLIILIWVVRPDWLIIGSIVVTGWTLLHILVRLLWRRHQIIGLVRRSLQAF